MALKKAIRIILTEHDLRRLIRGQSLTIHSGENPTLEVALADIKLSAIKLIVDEAELMEEGRKLGVLI